VNSAAGTVGAPLPCPAAARHAVVGLRALPIALTVVCTAQAVAHYSRLPVANAASAPPTNVAAAAATCFHIEGRSRVITTGSGGNP
jgi:hypothetical protein